MSKPLSYDKIKLQSSTIIVINKNNKEDFSFFYSNFQFLAMVMLFNVL